MTAVERYRLARIAEYEYWRLMAKLKNTKGAQ